jgi:hypothetical protein
MSRKLSITTLALLAALVAVPVMAQQPTDSGKATATSTHHKSKHHKSKSTTKDTTKAATGKKDTTKAAAAKKDTTMKK